MHNYFNSLKMLITCLLLLLIQNKIETLFLALRDFLHQQTNQLYIIASCLVVLKVSLVDYFMFEKALDKENVHLLPHLQSWALQKSGHFDSNFVVVYHLVKRNYGKSLGGFHTGWAVG